MRIKLIVGIAILVPVLAHLLYGFTHSTFTNYYITVDELVAGGGFGDRTIRVGGKVAEGSIRWEDASGTLHFKAVGEVQQLEVVYRGFIPDTFRDGVSVIMEGEYDGGGSFKAYGLLVKCPHRYLPAL